MRTPQLNDDVVIEITFPSTTEEWADELLERRDLNVMRDADNKLIVEALVGGNTNAVSVAQMILYEIADAFDDGEIDPMNFELTAISRARE